MIAQLFFSLRKIYDLKIIKNDLILNIFSVIFQKNLIILTLSLKSSTKKRYNYFGSLKKYYILNLT